MDNVQTVAQSHHGIFIIAGAIIAALALRQGVRQGIATWKRFKHRNIEFSNPALQLMKEQLPPLRLWREGLLAFLFAATGLLLLWALIDLYLAG